MNLFYLSESPEECASFHCDKHVVKQPVEEFQMLVSALLRHGVGSNQLPKTKSGTSPRGGYPHHPVTKWHGDSYFNFMKGADFGLALCQEYTARYKKTHFCEAGIKYMRDNVKNLAPDFYKSSLGGMTPYAIAISPESNCRKLPFFEQLPAIDKYRSYYVLDKTPIVTYKFSEKPYWFSDDYIGFLKQQYAKNSIDNPDQIKYHPCT